MEQHLSQYRVFYAVAKSGNISHAAKELFISQPAISKAISKLEESLGTTLFKRSSRGVTLTDEGQVLYRHVSSAFSALDRGENELKRMKNFNIGQLRFGVSNTLCKYVLLPYLKEFIQTYPHIRILISSQDTVHSIRDLDQHKVDIGLITEPKNKKELKFCPVMQIHDTFVCTPAYLENLRLREGADVNVFETATIMLLNRNNMTRMHIDSYLAEHSIEPRQLLETNTMNLLIAFSETGLGVGCVVREFVREALDAGNLIEIPLADPIPPRTIGFAWNPSAETRSMQQFAEFSLK